MPLSILDILGIAIFFLLGIFIYKRELFSSLYSFTKFLVTLITATIVGATFAIITPHGFPVTSLQTFLITSGIYIIVFWQIVDFRTIFFRITQNLGDISYKIFVHRGDNLLNLLPSLLVSFFITFFLFTVLVSTSTTVPIAQAFIEDSRVVKPIAYKVYFASISSSGYGILNGLIIKSVPAATYDNGKKNLSYTFPDVSRTPHPTPVIPTVTPESTPVPTQTPTPLPTPTPTPMPTITPHITNLGSPATPTPNPTPFTAPTVKPTPSPSPIVIYITPKPTSQPANYSKPGATPEVAETGTTNIPQSEIPGIMANLNVPKTEQDIFRLTNDQRIKYGLPVFIWDDSLARIARAMSEDMEKRDFFSHVNPDGLDPFDRMDAAGITFTTAGENIAGAPTADIIVTDWMESPGHRANILNPNFHHLGIGAGKSSRYGILATQDFTN